MTGSVDDTIVTFVHWLKLGVEILGAGLVALGVCVAMTHLIRTALARKPAEFTASRLILAGMEMFANEGGMLPEQPWHADTIYRKEK